MEIYRKIEKILLSLLDWFWRVFITIHECKNIYKKRYLLKNVVLTEEQKKKIDEFYIENYGKKIPYWWHRLYQSYTGKFDYRYIPEYIFTTKLELRSNKRVEVLPLENKNMLSVLFDMKDINVRTPETIIMCVRGRFYDGARNIVSREKAIEILKEYSNGSYEAVLKKTVDTSSGRDVRILNIRDGKDVIEDEVIESLLDDSKNANYVLQEKIVAHEAFKKLYSKSINTLRVVTYMLDDQIKTAPIIMRIGKGGGVVDNAHAGGIFIGVDDEGRLLKEAFTEYQQRYEVHPDTNIVFAGYQLPNIADIKQVAVQLHKQVPMLEYVSWDFTIDDNNKIVLIETNLHSQALWMSQMAHGEAFFGEDTRFILRTIGDNKKANDRFN